MKTPTSLLLQRNVTFSSVVQAISSSMLSRLKLSSFSYARIFSDGQFIYGSTCSDWTRVFYKSELYNNEDFQNIHFIFSEEEVERKTLLSGNPLSNSFQSILYDFNIWNILVLTLKRKEYTECWSFCGKPEDKFVLNLYMNHLDILQKFTRYFSEQFFQYETGQSEIPYRKLQFKIKEETPKKLPSSVAEIEQINKYYLSSKGQDIYLTPQEIACFKCLSHGQKIKDIALDLSLSPRTVEYYLNNIKIKMKLNKKSEILDVFFREELYELLNIKNKK